MFAHLRECVGIVVPSVSVMCLGVTKRGREEERWGGGDVEL